MKDRESIHEHAQAFFDDIWRNGDFWELETSEFERLKYDQQINVLTSGPYDRVLEIGCGSGCLSRRLASVSGYLLAIDISPLAIERARALSPAPRAIDFRIANIMEFDPRSHGPWDLVVMSETIYYLGWLYSFFNVAWLAVQLFEATRDGGEFLMANTCGGIDDYLMQPWLIRTYRDLFMNVGYERKIEDFFRGRKDGRQLETLVTVFTKAPKSLRGPAS
jgi:SAM-dependent methyltransferase